MCRKSGCDTTLTKLLKTIFELKENKYNNLLGRKIWILRSKIHELKKSKFHEQKCEKGRK